MQIAEVSMSVIHERSLVFHDNDGQTSFKCRVREKGPLADTLEGHSDLFLID